MVKDSFGGDGGNVIKGPWDKEAADKLKAATVDEYTQDVLRAASDSQEIERRCADTVELSEAEEMAVEEKTALILSEAGDGIVALKFHLERAKMSLSLDDRNSVILALAAARAFRDFMEKKQREDHPEV